MEQDNMTWAYQTMAMGMREGYRMPGVEYAFTDGSYCTQKNIQIYEAYARLRKRLGVTEDDDDVEEIIYAFLCIQKEMCYRMYQYGAKFGL